MDEDLIHNTYEVLMIAGRRMRANNDYIGGNQALGQADEFLSAHLPNCRYGPNFDASDFAIEMLREKLS